MNEPPKKDWRTESWIVSLVPAPPGMTAYYAEDDGSELPMAVVALALVEQWTVKGPRMWDDEHVWDEHAAKHDLERIVKAVTFCEDGTFDFAEDSSNFLRITTGAT